MASDVDDMEDVQSVFGIDLTKLQPCGEDLYWHGCYNTFRDWRKYVTPESFAHPAKMSPGLCDRIFKHLKKLELLKEDSVVCDFMSGIGSTNIMAALHGYESISVELEPHFVEMQEGYDCDGKTVVKTVSTKAICGETKKGSVKSSVGKLGLLKVGCYSLALLPHLIFWLALALFSDSLPMFNDFSGVI